MRSRTLISAAVSGFFTFGTSAIAETLMFDAGCASGDRVRIAAVGDLLFHDALQQIALRPGNDFRRFWQPVLPAFAAADIVYGNLEGPAAHGVAPGGGDVKEPGRVLDGRVYGKANGALVFNYHPSVITDLKASGFTIVSTANNHAADRGPLGIDRTIDNLRNAGLAFTGTRRRGEEQTHWSAITRAKGLSVAWLACTYSTNGMPDRQGQVLNCYSQRDIVMAELSRLAADPAIDAVVLTPHWGQEHAHQPAASDRAYARAAIEAGATAVIGAHPHVLQPWEKHVARDGREGLIVYSTGNFISNQPRPAQRSGVIVHLELTRPVGARARISAVGFVPTWVDIRPDGHRVVEMAGEPRDKSEPLALTLKLLPRGNRVTMAALDRLPRRCPGVAVASAAPAGSIASQPAPEPTPPAMPDVAAPAAVTELAVAPAPSARAALEAAGQAVGSGRAQSLGVAAANRTVEATLSQPSEPRRSPPGPRSPEPPRLALRMADPPLAAMALRLAA